MSFDPLCLQAAALSVYRASHVRADASYSSCLVIQLESVVYQSECLSNRQSNWTRARIVTNTVHL